MLIEYSKYEAKFLIVVALFCVLTIVYFISNYDNLDKSFDNPTSRVMIASYTIVWIFLGWFSTLAYRGYKAYKQQKKYDD